MLMLENSFLLVSDTAYFIIILNLILVPFEMSIQIDTKIETQEEIEIKAKNEIVTHWGTFEMDASKSDIENYQSILLKHPHIKSSCYHIGMNDLTVDLNPFDPKEAKLVYDCLSKWWQVPGNSLQIRPKFFPPYPSPSYDDSSDDEDETQEKN